MAKRARRAWAGMRTRPTQVESWNRHRVARPAWYRSHEEDLIQHHPALRERPRSGATLLVERAVSNVERPDEVSRSSRYLSSCARKGQRGQRTNESPLHGRIGILASASYWRRNSTRCQTKPSARDGTGYASTARVKRFMIPALPSAYCPATFCATRLFSNTVTMSLPSFWYISVSASGRSRRYTDKSPLCERANTLAREPAAMGALSLPL